MTQFDMFAAPPALPPMPAPVAVGEVIYTIVPKGARLAINWQCGEQHGVIGGLYDSEAEAQSCITFRQELRAQGIRDPRSWMRTPPEGPRP